MEPDVSRLDAFLDDDRYDGFLIDADGETSDQRYLSGFGAPDPFVTLYTPTGTHLLVSVLEYGRARKESRADDVRRYSEYDFRDLVDEHGRIEAYSRTVARFLADYDVDSVATPARFPLATADGLRDRDVAVTADTDDVLGDIRAVKTDEEIEYVRDAQTANEAAMRTAETLLADATVEDGILHHDGAPLTSERIREEIEITLLRHGCALDETIVAGGADGADPHNTGHGPLEADESVVVDIFPRDKETKYYGDMTRTFLVGDAGDEQRRRYDLTHDAFEAALAAVEPGVTGAAVHDAVCDVYEDAGYPTLRSDPTTDTGFIHSTGHGVGLDIHERPSISPSGGELEPGHVITIEPGLYHPEHGGVRIEDMVVVTEDGYENLTEYPIGLTPEVRR